MTGKERTFENEISQRIEILLDNLPEKPKAEWLLTTNELVGQLRSKIKAAQAKGYTLEEIVEFFKKSGAGVSVTSVKNALRDRRTRHSTKKVALSTKGVPNEPGIPPT